jgi:hypothetical protein
MMGHADMYHLDSPISLSSPQGSRRQGQTFGGFFRQAFLDGLLTTGFHYFVVAIRWQPAMISLEDELGSMGETGC